MKTESLVEVLAGGVVASMIMFAAGLYLGRKMAPPPPRDNDTVLVTFTNKPPGGLVIHAIQNNTAHFMTNVQSEFIGTSGVGGMVLSFEFLHP